MSARLFLLSIFGFSFSGCSSSLLESRVESKSNVSLCHSMVYKKKSLSVKSFTLMLQEALKRDLNCQSIAEEILKFQQKNSGMSGDNFISNEPSSNSPTEGINPATGQAPK
ncbi:hypothetical protein N9507_01920 [Gammaproteobacteria bacterium]|nr:hypothetical protein [Gammaproteobacteria bacterium]